MIYNNHVYFDFGMTPPEAEQMYRMTNLLLNQELEEHERISVTDFQDRLIKFLRKHPVYYGS